MRPAPSGLGPLDGARRLSLRERSAPAKRVARAGLGRDARRLWGLRAPAQAAARAGTQSGSLCR